MNNQTRLQSEFASSDTGAPWLPERQERDTLENIKVKPPDVRKLMKELDSYKKSGSDGISPFVLRD